MTVGVSIDEVEGPPGEPDVGTTSESSDPDEESDEPEPPDEDEDGPGPPDDDS